MSSQCCYSGYDREILIVLYNVTVLSTLVVGCHTIQDVTKKLKSLTNVTGTACYVVMNIGAFLLGFFPL